jgi:hypothetical protein
MWVILSSIIHYQTKKIVIFAYWNVTMYIELELFNY